MLKGLTTMLTAAFLAAGGVLPGDTPATIAIKNGMLIDGTGSPARPAHILVEGDTIVRVIEGDWPEDLAADAVIDAAGKVVTPGFMDTHCHGNPLQTPEFENFLAMGVTTISLGQDGSSTQAGQLGQWLRDVEAARPGPNVLTFIGHGTVRRESGIGNDADPSAEQIAAMADLVEQAMQAGAFGLSTGLEYYPGYHARLDELVAVARPVARHGGVVMSHMRSEDDHELIRSIEELMAQGRGAGARVHISHIKSVYGKGAERGDEIVAFLEKSRADGVEITAEIYPYAASFTGLGILFPEWAMPPNNYSEVLEARREELAAHLREIVTRRNGPEATLFGTGPYTGRTLADAAEARGVPFEEILMELGPRGASAAYFVMDQELMGRLLLDKKTNVSSDGSPTGRHPRGHGTFARVLNEFVNEKQTLELEEAIRKMTLLPATTMRLTDQKRGKVEEGWKADLLVFDPAAVRDRATFEEPHQLAEGFDAVLVNGTVVRHGGEFTGERAGRALRLTDSE